MAVYLRPETLAEALAALARPDHGLTILAGGTDVYPVRATRRAWGQPTARDILDISAAPELRGVRRTEGEIVLGATTTWTDILRADLPAAFDGLKEAARRVGGAQVQNRGAIAGNLCNASPAADGVPPLLTLDARVAIASARGARAAPLGDFLLGARRVDLAADELVTAIIIPEPSPETRATFLKLGARDYLVISIVSVAAALDVDAQGVIRRAAVAIGACSPVPVRLRDLERRLIGVPAREAARLVDANALAALAPIDDVRATAAYRLDAALTLTRRALSALAQPQAQAA